MQVIASEGRLHYLLVDADLEWYGETTVASLAMPVFSPAVQPEWRTRAFEMLRVTSPHLVASSDVSDRVREADAVPLYELGSTIGEGCSSVVMQAEVGVCVDGSASPNTVRRRGGENGLAVKVIRKSDQTSEALGDIERSVMWEVHVLQQLSHDHIVRVMDVIEVVDATYIIMQRVDGPELTDYVARQSHRRLAPRAACVIFSHIISALRHAHRHGFLHCDVKPDNVRLNKGCDHAVLTDWGYARKPGTRREAYMCGTPAYASPEQLTGYSPDSLTGQRTVSAATDVWSLGVTLFELVAGRLPFCAESYEELVREVLSLRYVVPDHVPSEVVALIQMMLHISPSDRASIDELCNSHHLQAASVTVPSDVESDGDDWGSGDSACDGSGVLDVILTPFGWQPGAIIMARRALSMLLYGSVCFAVIWMHLHSGPSNVILLHDAADG